MLTKKVLKLDQIHSQWIELPVLMFLKWQCDSNKMSAALLNQILLVYKEDYTVSTLKEMMMNI